MLQIFPCDKSVALLSVLIDSVQGNFCYHSLDLLCFNTVLDFIAYELVMLKKVSSSIKSFCDPCVAYSSATFFLFEFVRLVRAIFLSIFLFDYSFLSMI